MRRLIHNNHGFTLVEMLVSVSILVVLSVVFLTNFRAGEKKIKLKMDTDVLVSNVRSVQQMVLDGAKFGSLEMPLGGYGIHFYANKYILFADNNFNKVYDLGEGLATTTISRDIGLEYSYDNLIFEPPKAKVCLNNNNCALCDCNLRNGKSFFATTTLSSTGEKKVIKINQLSGRIEEK